MALFVALLLAVPMAYSAETATQVWRGTIWTGEKEQPWAEALAVRGNRIVAVGSLAEVKEIAGAAAKLIDARPGLITPGWIDSHVHLIGAGLHLKSVQLRDAASREEFVERIEEFAASQPPGAWITGGDWDHTVWGGALPDRAWIDGVTPDHPVWLARLDGHMALANSAALRAAGIADDVADIPGGEAVRDANGRLTGILKDNAMALIAREAPEPSARQKLEAIGAASNYLVERGVTSVHHMGSFDDLAALEDALGQGKLDVRVYAFTPLARWRQLAERIERTGRGNERLRIGGLKGFVDGSLGSHTAAFLEPYRDDASSRGLLVNSPGDLLNWTRGADQAGLQVAVHAIGDRANRIQLDVFEQVGQENGKRDRRFRIEHAQHIAPEDIARFAALDVIPSVQPYHIIDDGRWAEDVIGPKRSQTTYPFRSLLDSGARLALGSDWFVAPPSPIAGIYAAATRSTLDGRRRDGWTPAERITVEEALRGYTVDAAFAGFHQSKVGSLAVGKLADFVVVDRDITRVPASALRAARVLATVVDGQTVFTDAALHKLAAAGQQLQVDELVAAGKFADAEAILSAMIDDVDAPTVGDAAIRREVLRRIRHDFAVNQESLLAQLRDHIPDVTAEDLERWRAAGDLESRLIDGQRRYFRRGASNLMRFSADARSRRQDKSKKSAGFARVPHIQRLVELAEQSDNAEVHPVKHRITYRLTVPADHPRVRAGARAACWLPFPQEYRQQRDVRLLGCGPSAGEVSANGAPHRTIYLEQTINDATKPLEFWVEFEFITSAYCPKISAAAATPYDVSSETYLEYTAQRPPHIVITPEVATLVRDVIGDETNPLEQARLLFRWVSDQIPWCAEKEYSTIPNLSAKGLAARRGDCGVQAMTFITLCRAAGIPARWQSGWQTQPDDWNMHDWAEFYVEPWGWLPADASYGVQDHDDPRVRDFFCGRIDPYRLIVNLDYRRPLDPPKTSFRSEPNDFQRGEIEIDGHNLYFNEWKWDIKIEQSKLDQ